MTSVASSSSCLQYSLRNLTQCLPQVEEVFGVEDSVESFKRLLGNKERPSLRLSCTIPSWSSSPTHCLDLYDLQDLRNRSIIFLHELLRSLRASGVQATYRLIPSNMDLVTISTSLSDNYRPNVDDDLIATVQMSDVGKTFLAETKNGPVIVITWPFEHMYYTPLHAYNHLLSTWFSVDLHYFFPFVLLPELL